MTGEREEKKMPSLMATSLRWRTHSARTNKRLLGYNDPLIFNMVKYLLTIVFNLWVGFPSASLHHKEGKKLKPQKRNILLVS